MERLKVINVRGGGGIAKKGVQAELELVEGASRVYPETIPFLPLLATLIHTLAPKQLSLAEPINTIPENLGQPYHQADIDPFVVFVIDEVFLRITSREFQGNCERWQMNDLPAQRCRLRGLRCAWHLPNDVWQVSNFNVEVLLSLDARRGDPGPKGSP